MKKLATLAVLLSLGMFTFGCAKSETGETAPAATNGAAAPTDEAPAETHPADQTPADSQ